MNIYVCIYMFIIYKIYYNVFPLILQAKWILMWQGLILCTNCASNAPNGDYYLVQIFLSIKRHHISNQKWLSQRLKCAILQSFIISIYTFLILDTGDTLIYIDPYMKMKWFCLTGLVKILTLEWWCCEEIHHVWVWVEPLLMFNSNLSHVDVTVTS